MLPTLRNCYGFCVTAAITSKYDFDDNFVTKAHRETFPESICRFSWSRSMMVTADFVYAQYVKFRHYHNLKYRP